MTEKFSRKGDEEFVGLDLDTITRSWVLMQRGTHVVQTNTFFDQDPG